MTSSRSLLVGGSLMLSAAAAVVALAGLSFWPLAVVSLLPWALVASARWGGRFALAVVVTLAAWILLVSLTLSALVDVSVAVTSVTFSVLTAALGAIALLRAPLPDLRGWGERWFLWAPPLLGAIAWAAVFALAQVVPGAARVSWAMNGDSANNVLFERVILGNDGIAIGGGENPIPLPAALIAVTAAPGRDVLPVGDLLEHDVASLAVTWGLVVVLLSYLAGMVVAMEVPGRPMFAAMAGAAGSAISLTWFVSGYLFEFGFLSLHLALVVALMSWVMARSTAVPAATAIAALLVASTLMLAIWSPLVLVPFSLATARLAMSIRARELRLRSLVLIALGGVQLVVYGVVVTLPAFLAQRGFLAGMGGVIDFPRVIIAAIIVVAAGLIVLLVRRGQRSVAVLSGALVVGLLLVLGGLIALSVLQGGAVWSYYPTKFLWLLILIALLTLGGVLVGQVSTIPGRVARMGVGIAVAVAGIGGVLGVSFLSGGADRVGGPVASILSGAFADGRGDSVAERVFEVANPDDWTLLWGSQDAAEPTLTFWVLQTRAGMDPELFDLRTYAYGYDPQDLEALCRIIELFDEPMTVVGPADLEALAASRCGAPLSHVTFEAG